MEKTGKVGGGRGSGLRMFNNNIIMIIITI